MRMLCKMGWEMGQPLGRSGEGHTEPITLDVKLDRIGTQCRREGLTEVSVQLCVDWHPLSILCCIASGRVGGGVCYEAEICAILLPLRCAFAWYCFFAEV